jgi:hypothetical protein
MRYRIVIIEDVYHIWHECYRILQDDGILIASMSNGLCYLFDAIEKPPPLVAHTLFYNPLRDTELYEKIKRKHGGIEFSYSLEKLIGGQLKAGFILADLYEDYDTTGVLREYMPQYMATRAVKPGPC